MTKTILTGRKEIQNFVGRRWEIIIRWINDQNFPARKIDGQWESDAELIVEWRKDRIKNGV